MSTPSDEALEALWQQVLLRWDDDEVHRAFVDAATLCQGLAFCAGRYRAELESDARRERARQQLNHITTHALAMLEATRSPPRSNQKLITWVAFAVSFALVAGAVLAMTR